MPLLGAHQSIAGGYYRAVETAAGFGMDCVQIFTKNNNQWRAKPITEEDVRLFREALQRTGIKAPVGHTSYLINLASPDDALWQKSLDSFTHELERAEALGLLGLVIHPGAHCAGTEDGGLRRIVNAMDEAHRRTGGFKTLTLLETTAGQGSCLGHRFEHMATIIDAAVAAERFGLCVDTCHIFAAGYPLGTKADYARTMDELDRAVGLKRVKAFHLNDSLKDQGSRVDRHAHIGRGKLGLEPFRLLLNDPRFAKHPMYLETAKGEEDGEDLDAINLRVLRGLLKRPSRRK